MTKPSAHPLLSKSSKAAAAPPKRAADMMGALYEDVEKFFGDIFAYYARFIVRFPVQFITVPVLICGLLGLGLLNMEYEFRVEKLYTPVDGKATSDKEMILSLFPENDTNNFYPHQEITTGVYGEIIFTCPSNKCPNNNVLFEGSLREIRDLLFVVNNISVDGLTYNDLCARRHGTCVVNGKWILDIVSQSNCINSLLLQTIGADDPYDDVKQVLADVTKYENSSCVGASAYKLKFNLNPVGNSSEQSLSWQKQFLKVLKNYPETDYIEISFTVTESLDIDIRDHVGKDTQVFVYSVVAMFVYATILGGGRNWVSNHVMLAYAGVLATLMSIMAAFGFISLCGLKFANMCGVMPFLIIGVGVDDMFQLMTEWRQTNIRDTISRRMSRTMRSAAVSITITSLSDILAFCIGATSPFINVKNFCAVSGVAILFCYFNQMTFFSGCLVLHAKRVASGRHCITCLQTTPKENVENEAAATCHVIFCHGAKPRNFSDEGGICRPISRYFYMVYPRFLLHWLTKTFVILFLVIYFCASVWGISLLKRGFRFEDMIQDDSYLSSYVTKNRMYYPDNGPVVMFVTPQTLPYHKAKTVENINGILERADAITEVVPGTSISWLAEFERYLKNNNLDPPTSEGRLIDILQSGFLKAFPQFYNDIKVNKDLNVIEASRFYVLSKTLNDSQMEENLLIESRRVANSSPYTFMTAYSTQFIYFEQYISILKETLLAVGVTMIGLLFVALVFIPHPIAISCVTLSMISVVLGMLSSMAFLGLELSALTTIQIILCVALCVDSTVHMSHAFMTATGKNRNERVTVALEKVGIPILNATFSSFLGISMLALGDSYIFKTFCKTFALALFLQLLHSVVFLPVMLSFIGPRRTSKPRVFIPVSPSCRSLQDTYRANSISYSPTRAERPTKLKVERPLFTFTSAPTLQRSRSLPDIEKTPKIPGLSDRRVSFAVGEAYMHVDMQGYEMEVKYKDAGSRKSPVGNKQEMEVLLEQCEENDEERTTIC